MPTDQETDRACQMCQERSQQVTMDIENEGNGEMLQFHLCNQCRDLVEKYNRGEDVEWPERLNDAE